MNTIEMTDVDGDALTLITREHRTWITCTSGPEEVTVGPFPAHLVHRLFSQGAQGLHTSMLLGPTAPTPTPTNTLLDDGARERAWDEFSRLAQEAPLREAVDGALAAAVTSDATARSETGAPDAARPATARSAVDPALAVQPDADPATAAQPSHDARALAEDLRHVSLREGDSDALAAHLLSLGYRKG